jgi:hypothetical protein
VQQSRGKRVVAGNRKNHSCDRNIVNIMHVFVNGVGRSVQRRAPINRREHANGRQYEHTE